jgi:hypothetical protein
MRATPLSEPCADRPPAEPCGGNQQEADSDEPLYLPALKTAAEPLRFLDFLIYEPVKAVVPHGGGTAVTVPSPERFAVHKLILSRPRKSSEAKADKDLRQAAVLLQILLQKRLEDLKRVWEEAVQRAPSGGNCSRLEQLNYLRRFKKA